MYSGKLSRTEWRIQKSQNDVGDFATAIDHIFTQRDNLSQDAFFLVLFHWAGLQEVDVEPDAELQKKMEEELKKAQALRAKNNLWGGDADSDDRSGGTANLADLEGEWFEREAFTDAPHFSRGATDPPGPLLGCALVCSSSQSSTRPI